MRKEDVSRRYGLEGGEFYITSPAPCPYLEGKCERKIFSYLGGPAAPAVNAMLTRRGFRRSQKIIYLPACESCSACVPVRIITDDFQHGRSRRRILNRNTDIIRRIRAPRATSEQYGILRSYLDSRHFDGGMVDMTVLDYASMVEETTVETSIAEYSLREPSGEERLIAIALTDTLSDGLSMIYSFFDPDDARRSLGQYMILDHVAWARELGLSYVYLGYWVEGSRKMDYKNAFQPLEKLTQTGWVRMDHNT